MYKNRGVYVILISSNKKGHRIWWMVVSMKTFRMADVEKIEKMIADGKTVVIEWHTPYERGTRWKQLRKLDGMAWYLQLVTAFTQG